MSDRRTLALATAAGVGAIGLAYCLKALYNIQVERSEEKADSAARSKAVKELHTKFEAILDEKKTPAVDIKWRTAPIGGHDFPVEKDLFELIAATTMLAKPPRPQQKRRASGAAPEPVATKGRSYSNQLATGSFATVARAVKNIVGLRQSWETEPFDLAPWEEAAPPSADALKRLSAALVPLVEVCKCEGAFTDAAKKELLEALQQCCS